VPDSASGWQQRAFGGEPAQGRVDSVDRASGFAERAVRSVRSGSTYEPLSESNTGTQAGCNSYSLFFPMYMKDRKIWFVYEQMDKPAEGAE
jgi:hypothetical protein